MNAALGLAICSILGLDLSEVKAGLRSVNFPERRLSVHRSIRNSILIDDSYNSNPSSMKRSIDLIESLKNYRKLCVFGEMKELGEDSSFLHADVYQYAKDKVDYFFCIGKEWEDIKITSKANITIFSDHDDLYKAVKELIKQDTVILVKGSRSTKMDIVADKLKN